MNKLDDLTALKTNKEFVGLTATEALKRLDEFGPNSLPQAKPISFIGLFLLQFKSPFIYVLLIASFVSFYLNQTINGWFILGVLIINALIGSIQEYSASKAALALQAMVPSFCHVYRDGQLQTVPSKSIVKGDVVFLSSGDKIPADGVVLLANNLHVNESLLSGESKEVRKLGKDQINKNKAHENNGNDALESNCYGGTIVTHGRGWISITKTGTETEIGEIASTISKTNDVKSPLRIRIEKFTIKITLFIAIIISIIFLTTLARGESLEHIFLLGVALAVSAIPEGLPAAITVALAIGMRRMARQNVIVRSLLAVESLGSCTYIASDKTGTLTLNQMSIQKLWTIDGVEDKLERFVGRDMQDANNSKIRQLIETGALTNEAQRYIKDNVWHEEGDQVDLAFLRAYEHAIGPTSDLRNTFIEVATLPYESEQSFSASLHKHQKDLRVSIKGSVEEVTKRSKLNDEEKNTIINKSNELASQGYRVIALAHKSINTDIHSPIDDLSSLIQELSFIGLVGILDPIREGVEQAIHNCREAGIEVGMLTGDQPETASTISKRLGISTPPENIVIGTHLDELSNNRSVELADTIKYSHTFARVKPHQKKVIIDELKRQGHFVAVTGDGVNDAPALKSAHVGIAMGKRGTDVARESADLILTDDNFLSIVNGIVEGRVVYANIRKVIFLLISTGAAEILMFLMSLVAGLPLPLYPIQLLWLNLVTNGIQDVALAFEPAEGDELKKPPRVPNEPIFNHLMIQRVVINAVYIAALAFALFFFALEAGMSEFEARNLTLLLMVCFENVHALNSRSETRSLFHLPWLSNPLLIFGIITSQGIHILSLYSEWMNEILQVGPVSLKQWTLLVFISLSLILIDELHKKFYQKRAIAIE